MVKRIILRLLGLTLTSLIGFDQCYGLTSCCWSYWWLFWFFEILKFSDQIYRHSEKKIKFIKNKKQSPVDQQHGLNPYHWSKPIKLVRNHLNNFKNHQLVQNHQHGQTDYYSINGIIPDQFDWFWPVLWVETMLLVILLAVLIFRNFEGLWPNLST